MTCNGLPGAHYFLSTMTAAMPLSGMENALQLGLGLCVPEARQSGRVMRIVKQWVDVARRCLQSHFSIR